MILKLHFPPIPTVSSFKFIVHVISQLYNFSGLYFFCLDLLTEKTFRSGGSQLTNIFHACITAVVNYLRKSQNLCVAIQFICTLNTGDLSFLCSAKIVSCLHTTGLFYLYPLSLSLSFILLGFWMMALLHIEYKDM